MKKVAYVELDDGLTVASSNWQKIKNKINESEIEILILNEMPFGSWRPVTHDFNIEAAETWVDEHENCLNELKKLNVSAVVSSRPIMTDNKLINEAFSIENGEYKTLHHKHFFPSEEGWYEESWFRSKLNGFQVHSITGINIGILLCTELMYNEHARQYGRDNADLIAVPRASGLNKVNWNAACAMASVVSGAYVVSSNRVGSANLTTPNFGGGGLAYAPGGEKIGQTGIDCNLMTFELNPEISRKAKAEYPCYLRD